MEARLRDKIDPHVFPCDVHKENPLEPATPEPYDIISSQLCLESACLSEDDYERALRNISSLLKPGGSVYQFGSLQNTYYPVGEKRFKTLYLTLEYVEQAFKTNGFRDVVIQTHMYPEGEVPADMSDVKGMFIARAVKGA